MIASTVRGFGTEGRRHLGGLEDAEAAARAGADEDNPAVLARGLGDHLDADGDPLALALHCVEHLAIFVDHQVDDVVCGELVDAEADGVDGFRGRDCHLERTGIQLQF
jgi:hypothetical protein